MRRMSNKWWKQSVNSERRKACIFVRGRQMGGGREKTKQSQRMMCCDCRLFCLCGGKWGRYWFQLVLCCNPSVSASFAQGSQNKVLYCGKNPLLKFIQTSRADDIRPYEIVLIYNIVWPSIIDIYTDSPSYGRTNTVAYFNFFSRRTPLYGPSVQVPTGTKPRFS